MYNMLQNKLHTVHHRNHELSFHEFEQDTNFAKLVKNEEKKTCSFQTLQRSFDLLFFAGSPKLRLVSLICLNFNSFCDNTDI